ncbi:MAG: RNA 2',3'-cyclic phosphodiesterase [Nanoarchaeota archaeon]
MRIFIAINLSESARAKVFHEFETLEKKNFFKGRFVEKENLHLTLKFMGDLPLERVEDAKKKLKELKFKKFKCSVGKPGVFNSENHIKVIWVELISKEIGEIERQISEKFSEIKSDFEKFNSHITIARVNSVTNKEGLINYLKKINFKNLDFEVKEILLMKSELTPRGPIYRVIEKFTLE